MIRPSFVSMNVDHYFPRSYVNACELFRKACVSKSINLTSYENPVAGPKSSVLTTDVAYIGHEKATKLLVVISGVHGLEGLAGSGCQTAWLHENDVRTLPKDVGVLLVHLLNPWGCAWLSRQNEENVDLNRNFLDFGRPLPPNRFYDEVRQLLFDRGASGTQFEEAKKRLSLFRQEQGERAFASALFQGQYTDSSGIGFGGTGPSWSRNTLRDILRDFAEARSEVAVIDLHTGYGPFGWGTLLSTQPKGSAGLMTAKDWYGNNLVALRDTPEGMPYDFSGDLTEGIMWSLEDANAVVITLEFGTYSVERLLELQIENWIVRNRKGNEAHSAALDREKQHQFFYPASIDWLQAINFRCSQIIGQTITCLERPSRSNRA